MVTGIIFSILLIILVILYQKREKESLNKNFEEDNITDKQCKYCKSKIEISAKVCPYCRKEQKSFHIWKVVIGVAIGCFIMFYIFIKIIRSDYFYGTYKEGNENYITLTEFEKIENGMTLQEVKNIISCELTIMSDTQVSDESYQIYYCYGKDGISNANFSFENDKLVNKTQIGLN